MGGCSQSKPLVLSGGIDSMVSGSLPDAATTGSTNATSASKGGKISQSSPVTRDRLDSWANNNLSSSSTPPPATAVMNGGTTSQSSTVAVITPSSTTTPISNNNKKKTSTPANPPVPTLSLVERQWSLLWESHASLIVDPADVPAVLDSLVSTMVNRLSSVEITMIQRKLRLEKRQLLSPSSKASASTRSNSISSGKARGSKGGAGVEEQEAVALADKQFLIHPILFSRLWNHNTNNPAVEPLFKNAYILLLHLSETLWDRVTEVAALSARKAGLDMDVNHHPQSSSTSSTVILPMPKPSTVPDISSPPELPSGITVRALAFFLALGLYGSRSQRLCLLFWLCADNVGEFLARHPAGGLPTWLLEVDQQLVLSVASLTHYHYFGTSFLPNQDALGGDEGRRFVSSQSRQPPTLSPKTLQTVILHLFRSSNSSPESSLQAQQQPSLSTPETSHHTAIVASYAGSVLMQRLRASTAAPVLVSQTLVQTWKDSFADANTNWTLQAFFDWADPMLDDSLLDALFQALLCPGILPTSQLELAWTRQAWQAWQQHSQVTLLLLQQQQQQQQQHSSLSSRDLKTDENDDNGLTDQNSSNGSTSASNLALIAQSVQALLTNACNPTTTTTAASTPTMGNGLDDSQHLPQFSLQKSLTVWGGLGGLDGGGGMGYGVLYCIDKRWWDAWTAYVGWPDGQGDGNSSRQRLRLCRPGVLSNQSLIDTTNTATALAGTLGFYECMKRGLVQNVDYVLVPPSVWNVLLEIYGGGPPLPRMVEPLLRPRKYSTGTRSRSSSSLLKGESAVAPTAKPNLPGTTTTTSTTTTAPVEVITPFTLTIPDTITVVVHPWILHVVLCDPLQPYRRGEAGPVSIRVMATSDQPLWRLYMELVCRFTTTLNSYKAFCDNLGKARLWKKVEMITQQPHQHLPKDPVSRYGPWNLLCKSRWAILPLLEQDDENTITNIDEARFKELEQNWIEYTDNATVESVGLGDGDHVMLEFAVLDKIGELMWPREAAAKAGRVRRIAEEDAEFRQAMAGVDDKGSLVIRPVDLIGMEVDAMDATGRWYPVKILEVEVIDDDTEEEDHGILDDDDEIISSSHPPRNGGASHKRVRVDFTAHGGHQEWIDVESDRLAKAGRFTSEAEKQSVPSVKSNGKANGSSHGNGNDTTSTTASMGTSASASRPKALTPIKKNSNVADVSVENGKICLLPGYGACGLTNLGNTCYVNSAIQCISYLPLLRSYLLSAQYKSNGDLNRDNPLGTGGKLLEEFADLLRHLWNGRMGEKSPSKMRTQLGKCNPQFAGADQQDAQEFLNYILDVLHEDSNKVRKKPMVEALEDDWVKRNSLPRVGDEAWRRFLRRNRSIMADVAMGQVLNTVTCPVCNFSSRNFDPFNLLSIPIPTVADVVFQCTVYRRASALNCPWILNKPRKGERSSLRFVQKNNSSISAGPPSDKFVAEQYVIAMSRLADSGDLRLQIQNACGIPANLLRLCRAEEIVVNRDVRDDSAVKRQMKVIPLTDKDGPCSQLAKKRLPGNDDGPTAPTLIVAFESTLRPRPVPRVESKEEPESLEDTADEEDELEVDDNHIQPTNKEVQEIERFLEVYGDQKECRLVDTNPLVIAKAVSRSVWPRTQEELKLGLRVDAKDHRGNWFPGSVVEIIDDEVDGGDADTGEEVKIHSRKVRVHFDNFSSKWDEMYSIEDFEKGRVRPLYSHASPRPKPTEFVVHHRHSDRNSGRSVVFGQSFYVQCQNEWSNARAGAHILAQSARFMMLDSAWSGSIDVDDPASVDREAKSRRLYEKTQSTISELIDLLVDCDREYVSLALGVSDLNTQEEKEQPFRNPGFDPTSLSVLLVKRVSNLLQRLPFEVRVCTVDASSADKPGANSEEISFPFSLVRTIGNYMNARHAIVLLWREPPVDKKSAVKTYLDAPVMYVQPPIQVDLASAEILKNKARRDDAKTSRAGSAGIDLGVCLTEFCKVQNLTISDTWRCPQCKEFREGRQSMDVWRLPDLLTFHIKRFNMSARWREKITTKVNFPLTGLDMGEWCHKASPMIRAGSSDALVYDLIGVTNHYGSMTGGHYVATCKATPCGRDGSEEVGYSFSGVGTNATEKTETDEPTGWRLGVGRSSKAEASTCKVAATSTSKAVADSAEPLWLQFDDELVEPLPPGHVVSEMAYVLFYRRRQLTPSNISKYCTLG